MKDESEALLLRLAAEGETEAFQAIYEVHHAALFRLASEIAAAMQAAVFALPPLQRRPLCYASSKS